MALILTIDSAFEECVVTLCNNEEVIAHERSVVQKDHASFLQPAIKNIIKNASTELSSIDAVAVLNGPGSYTGLRVGLASAKGICYVLNKPLILLNTLDVLAFALQQNHSHQSNVLLCPMIDARRMEVFTALYDHEVKLVKDYASVILGDEFLNEEKNTYKIIVGGNGSSKLRSVAGFENISFGASNYSIHNVATCAIKAFGLKAFADLAYCEPFYIKPAYVK